MSGGRGGRRYGNEEEQSRKLFVGGLSFDTTDESLKEYFMKYGKLTDCVVIKEKNSTKSKGFGFVTYETEQEADSCMSDRPHQLQGRTVDVKRAVSREESSKPGAHVSVKKVFVGGLKEHHTEDMLREFFSQHGNIEQCEIMTEKGTNKNRGFGFVTFTDFDAVDKLVAKRMYEISGCKCEVKKALSRAEMEKAKSDAEIKAARSDGYGGGRGGFGQGQNGYESYGGYGGRGGGGGYGGGYGGYGGYGDAGGFGGGYGGYEDSFGGGRYAGYEAYESAGGRGGGGYGGYGGRNDYGGYSSGYGSGGSSRGGAGGGSSYGPVRGGSYSQRSSGPYGGGFGSGGGQGYGAGGGYGGQGYGNGQSYGNGQGYGGNGGRY